MMRLASSLLPVPGYFADPCAIAVGDSVYVYATIDPWGGDRLACWKSADLESWTRIELSWPTKSACTSPTSGDAMVWAPSVVRTPRGFFMYVSVGSEVWAGKADRPEGPWRNAVPGGGPLIPGDLIPGYHMIDAEAFIDDDGSAWLYWGSGLNWVNGHCFAARLGGDMVSFTSAVVDVTPKNYFEAPYMVKRHGLYYLMYSNGNTTLDTYEVRYAVGRSPLGPFVEGRQSPLLKTDHTIGLVSPGHHTILSRNGTDYIIYHRLHLPAQPGETLRELCIGEIDFKGDGEIYPVL